MTDPSKNSQGLKMLYKIHLAAGDPQLLADVVAMVIDRPHGGMQEIRDLFGAKSFFDHVTNLFFPSG